MLGAVRGVGDAPRQLSTDSTAVDHGHQVTAGATHQRSKHGLEHNGRWLGKKKAVGYRHIHAAVATRAQAKSADRVDHRTGIRECGLVWSAEEAVALGRDDVLGLDPTVPLLSVLVAKLC